MPTLTHPRTTLALLAARQNVDANRQAMVTTQRALAETLRLDDTLEWVFGRDGALTARDAAGGWVNECSVPMLAARNILRDLRITGGSACFIDPDDASLMRQALSRLEPSQALLAVVPNHARLPFILACEDFSAEIAARRLWFFAGDDWVEQMRQTMLHQPGLMMPSQFIRLPHADPLKVNPLVSEAQRVLGDIGLFRKKRMQELVTSRKPGSLCIAAAGRFGLWQPTISTLEQMLKGLDVPINAVTADHPDQRSPLAVAEAAAQSGALLCVDLGRADLPGLLHPESPWLTWVTNGRIPQPGSAIDRLLLADEAWTDRAVKAGWNAGQMIVAPWPAFPKPPKIRPNAGLNIFADLAQIAPPTSVREMSSHMLLWESIRDELLEDPFAVTVDGLLYLRRKMRDAEISSDGFDMRAVLERLIEPCYAVGIARTLVRSKISIQIWGTGWDQFGDMRPFHAGPISYEEHLHHAIGDARAVVHVWPTQHAHPIFCCGRPVVSRDGARPEAFIRAARQAVQRDKGDDKAESVPAKGASARRREPAAGIDLDAIRALV